jgi:very-short-patch-repair endonuclease
MTKSERRLWARLRRKQVRGCTFYRQFIILRYIVDFYCRTPRLVIEVDGISHDDPEAAAQDVQRPQDLEALGITVLRVPSARIMNDLDHVLQAIDGCVADLARSHESGRGEVSDECVA